MVSAYFVAILPAKLEHKAGTGCALLSNGESFPAIQPAMVPLDSAAKERLAADVF
jgi:hypothetical protein